jgi:hypothetical protein
VSDPLALRTGSVFTSMRCRRSGAEAGRMPCFLVEVRQSDDAELDRATRTLQAAQSRLWRTAVSARPRLVAMTREDGRMVFLIEAESNEAVRSLVGLALLPAGRIRELVSVPAPDAGCGRSHGGPDPGADLAPGVDAELVEDVVDMRLDGSLGDE